MNNIEDVKEKAMSDGDIKQYLPDTKIVTYSDLKKYKSLNELLPNVNDCVVILYQTSPNYGHWTALLRYRDEHENDIIEYYDSYGHKIDEPLSWVSKKELEKMNIHEPYLMNLIKNTNDKFIVISNARAFQGSNPSISTCGRHVCARLIHFIGKRSTLKSFLEAMNKAKKNVGGSYDDVVARIINKEEV